MEIDNIPCVMFDNEFGEREEFEAKSRGYLSGVQAVFVDGRTYDLTFWSCTRLQQDLEDLIPQGIFHIADPGMIVVSEITLPIIQSVVLRLNQEQYFESLVPMKR